MSNPVVHDSLQDRAAGYAARGEWGTLRALLEEYRGEAAQAPALVLLLAEADLRTGHLPEAHALLRDVVPALEGWSEPAVHRRALNMLGASAFELGLLEEAEPQFERTLALATAAGDFRAIGHATNNLGMIAHIRGGFDQALSLYQLAVPAFQRVGYVTGLGETYHNMALSLREKGALDLADKQERRAIECAREAGNRRLLAITQVGRAELSLRRGEPVVAEAGAWLGASEYAAIPDAVGEADALRLVGLARLALGHVADARTVLGRSVGMAADHGSPLIEAEARSARARAAAEDRDWPAVARDVEAAVALFRRLGADQDRVALERWYGETRPR